MLKFLGSGVLSAALVLSLCNGATAADRVLTESPATDGAYVVKMQGLTNNVKIKLLDGNRKTIDDGIVIRKSYVKDGKVIIPPSGLYTMSRCSNWWSFNDHTFTIAGKLYHFITDEYQQDVIKNITMKEGDKVFGDANKTYAWHLKTVDKPFGVNNGHMLYFYVVKSTGNNYGNTFIVTAGDKISPKANDGTAMKKGSGLKVGSTSWENLGNGLSNVVGNSIATNGSSAVIVEKVNGKEVKIKELVSVSTKKALISPNDPIMGLYGKGDTFKVGNATVEVVSVAKDTATLKITDASGSVTKKLVADKKSLEYFPASRSVCQNMLVQSKSGKELVNINPRNEGGVFVNGKVALMAHSDVISVGQGTPWEADNRFIARPDICKECSFIHEIVLENDKEIVLDEKNNTYTGPEGYFTIVIDKMDKDRVAEWHVETAKDKTENLAGRAQGKHIDMVIGAACRSTGHFFSRVYSTLYKEALGIK